MIGGGVAGLSCARRLAESGCAVTVFDKGRKPGGRAATRRAGGFAFDHGAQYFTARDTRLQSVAEAGRAVGLVAAWNDREVRLPPTAGAIADKDGDGRDDGGTTRWVAVPGMSALARCLLGDFEVRCGLRIDRIERDAVGWRLRTSDGTLAGAYETVAVAVPAPQAAALLAPLPALARRAASARLAPCWALMLGFDAPLAATVPAAASVTAGPLAWICHDGAKPGRAGGDEMASWIVHATPAWSRAHLENDAETVARALLQAFGETIGTGTPKPAYIAAHRWRFARVETALGEPFLYDREQSLGACGDWCIGAKIEAAFLSGLTLAERILAPA